MKKLLAILLLAASAAAAQTLSPDVQQYVKVDAPTIILRGVRVIDGTGAAAKENQVVRIVAGKIESVADQPNYYVGEGLTCPSCRKTIDATGMTLLPGLVL